MVTFPGDQTSFWHDGSPIATYPMLNHDLQVDVVIIGGGIAGLTAAYMLKQAGKYVVVLEKNTLASGTTGGTTGKVTSQHGLIYADLHDRLGAEVARAYAAANHEAFQDIKSLIHKEHIKCEWQDADNYVYTSDISQVETFKNEARIAAELGLPAHFENSSELPFDITAAVKFSDQANFNAVKYVHALARLVDGAGSKVYENSQAVGLRDGKPARVRTKYGTVIAKDIVVATKMPTSPLVARLACAAVERPVTSYIVAGHTPKKLAGMYISPDKNHYSLLGVDSPSGPLLLVGGESHTPGMSNPDKRYDKLADYASQHFGIQELTYKWKAMDYLAYDDVPLIGKVYPWSRHMYTATAFHKWGLTTSMAAAKILRDTILNKPNPWAKTFSPQRTTPILSIPHTIKQIFQ